MSYDPKGRGNPGLTSWSQDGVGLFYVPGGMNPYSFSAYNSDVV
jgi:hypothetical protein